MRRDGGKQGKLVRMYGVISEIRTEHHLTTSFNNHRHANPLSTMCCNLCSYHRSLDGPQSRSGRCGEAKNLFSLLGLEPRLPGRLTRSVVAILTELSRLLINSGKDSEY
jgi:hypothetical protein